MIAWCSFLRNNYIVANSSGKTIYMYKIIKYGEDAKGKTTVDMSLECTFQLLPHLEAPTVLGAKEMSAGLTS